MIREVESHEFWLPDLDDPRKSSGVYRVTLGELIDATQRKTFTPHEGNPECRNKSGSIGFMNVKIEDELVPKVGAKPFPNPSRRSYLAGLYDGEDYEFIRALVINDIAIEPPYRKQGYATHLKKRAEELAREWGLTAVVSPYLQSPRMRRISKKLGYTLYDRENKAVKRLNCR